jgi:hypothetical protein
MPSYFKIIQCMTKLQSGHECVYILMRSRIKKEIPDVLFSGVDLQTLFQQQIYMQRERDRDRRIIPLSFKPPTKRIAPVRSADNILLFSIWVYFLRIMLESLLGVIWWIAIEQNISLTFKRVDNNALLINWRRPILF